ncbi:MAG: DUF2281 domain-containing protein [Balneolales bacterium]|nr:DUF2281 domain-containing protein [Balneolales bacterium]
MITNPAIDIFDELPPEAQKQAIDFVMFLYERYVKSAPKPKHHKDDSFYLIVW